MIRGDSRCDPFTMDRNKGSESCYCVPANGVCEFEAGTADVYSYECIVEGNLGFLIIA